MRKRLVSFVLVLAMLSLPFSAFAKSKWTDWWKPGEWFGKKQRSTTITGMVEAVADGKVMFKNLDGQMIQLIGDQAAKVAENRAVKVRVFGNVFKPDQKFPAGALQVRSFKVLDEQAVTPTAVSMGQESSLIDTEPEPYVEPEPVVEPAAVYESEPEPYVEEPSPAAVPQDEHMEDDDDAALADEHHDEPEASTMKEYVVVSGDTLGKISQKVYGSSAKWKKIAQFNGINNPKLLKVGMTLRIPQD